MTAKYILSNIPTFTDVLLSDDEKPKTSLLKVLKTESYKVIRYDKALLTTDLIPSYGLARSIIVNSANQVVGFAPPKSIPADVFMRQCECSNALAEEFVEGTMINVFFDPAIGVAGSWQIATRNTVGATSSFYTKTKPTEPTKTFRDMFMEAVAYNHVNLYALDPTFCYSFVLQHPENRIVVPFSTPQLYLVAVYEIKHKITNDINEVVVNEYDVSDFFTLFSGTTVKFPAQFAFDNYVELIDKYGSMNTPYDVVGVVIRNTLTGERTKIRNPVYEQVRSLRGNQPKLQYQYLCLRKEGKVKEFLTYYPEYKKDFLEFREQVHLFTKTLFTNYLACYVKKQKPLMDFSEQYRTHMFQIHKQYMDTLREAHLHVTNVYVQQYVNQLHPSLLMYSLNYPMRKKMVDTIRTNN